MIRCFHWLLTGKRSIKPASTSQLIDPQTKTWSDDLIEDSVYRHIFMDVIEPGSKLGPVQPSVASVTGLEDVPVVVPATHDTASAVLSVPEERLAPSKPTWCYISSGTWSLMGCELSEPKVNTLLRIELHKWGGVGAARDCSRTSVVCGYFSKYESRWSTGQSSLMGRNGHSGRVGRTFHSSGESDDPSLNMSEDMITAITELAEEPSQTALQTIPFFFGQLWKGSRWLSRLPRDARVPDRKSDRHHPHCWRRISKPPALPNDR